MITNMANVKMIVCLCFAAILAVTAFGFGGWEDVQSSQFEDIHTAHLAANFAVKFIDERDGANYRSRIKNIINIKRQIVAGRNWKFTFTKQETLCIKGTADEDLDNCLDSKNPEITCSVVVYQNLQNKFSLTEDKCKKAGYDFDMNKAALFAASKANEKMNMMFAHKLVKVLSSKKQADGSFLLKLIIGETSCRNNGNLKPDDCSFSSNENRVNGWQCDVAVFFKPKQTSHFEVEDNQLTCQRIAPFALSEISKLEKLRKKRSLLTVNMDRASEEENTHWVLFQDFKARYNKIYHSKYEEDYRLKVFVANMEKVRQLQATERGSGRYGATKFADMTEAEFRKSYLSPVWKKDTSMPEAEIPKVNVPTSFDWRTKGAVSEVKNQGECGSCWAFSTTGNIEGQWFLKKKKMVSLSEQELVDCDKVDQGCNGGLPSNAYKEIIRLGGLEGESDYPYKGYGAKCDLEKSKIRIYINSSVAISQDEQKIAIWLALNGPVSIGINAAAMQFYFGGVSHPWKIFCNPKNLDHGVLIVGYGVKGTEPYWIIKNSWGSSWGEDGYYLVYRGDGVCGLNTMCTSAVVN